MKLKKYIAVLVLFISSITMAKPNIMVLATGGTIAGFGGSAIKSSYTAGKLPVHKLFENIPEVTNLATINYEQFINTSSHEFNSTILLDLAKRVNDLIKQNDIDSIIITHGTDTLEETAYFLNLTINSDKPIVLVGSMRPSSSISSDGSLNLYNAVNVAINKNSYGKGVLVVINDEIHSAREVMKVNTSAVNAFSSVNTGKIGSVYYGNINYYMHPVRKHTYQTEFDITKIDYLPRVDIIYGYPNDTDVFIEAVVKSNTQGIVYAGMGNGNLSPTALIALADSRSKGVTVARSSRTGCGRTNLGGEFDDKKYGFIVTDNLNPQKSRILLMLGLTQTDNTEKLQQMYFNY